jgi:beta-lactam-binding protein with PASTA domain
MVVGGPSNGTIVDVPWSTATTGTVTLPVPAAGAWIRWEVRSVFGATTSRWVVARAVLPQVVGRKTAAARTLLRSLGVLTSTYTQATTVTAQVGRVVAQSTPAGRAVTPGTSIALGIGKLA